MAGIVYYNAAQIRRRLRDGGWQTIPAQYRRYPEQELLEGYESLSDFFESVPFVDRTNILRHFLAVENVCPLPVFENLDGNFEYQCEHRAAEIAETGQEIVLFWSGGIDSTVAILSLILAGKTDQVQVVLTHMSILENPNFYHGWIEGKFRTTILNSEDVRQNYTIGPRQILVTGELGDQLFGSMFIFKYTYAELMSPWVKMVPEKVQEFIKPMMDNLPCEVKSLFDFLWWINFNLKWQNVKYRFIARAEHLCNLEQLYHYFDALYFQKWSVMTDQQKIVNHHKTYKWAAKEYIYKYTKDEDFLYNKLKVPSLRSNPGKTNPTFLFADGKRIIL